MMTWTVTNGAGEAIARGTCTDTTDAKAQAAASGRWSPRFPHKDRDGAAVVLAVEEAPRQCRCGAHFVPTFGEFHRCPQCMGEQLDAAELATIGL